MPTVASDTGAFARMIQDGKTGILCENTESAWFVGMESLVKDINYRKQIAQNAYQYVIENCTTIVKSAEFAEYIKCGLHQIYLWFFPRRKLPAAF